MNRDEFLLKLSDRFNITEVNKGEYTPRLEMNKLAISGDKYPLFGYYVGGTHYTCLRSDKNDFTQYDLEEAIKYCSGLLMSKIKRINRIPNYYTINDYLKGFGKTKVEKDSIKRVFNILKENYNDIIRYNISKENS